MPEEAKFAIYFSHSWRPRDVDLNLLAWSEVSDGCELLVDAPEEGGADPPYYINRIEELLRRSDLFLCVLTHRTEEDRSAEGPDGALQCSVYAAFEIRLAEQRFDLPRLVLYERSTGFKAPLTQRANEVYIAFDRGTADLIPDGRQWKQTIAPKIRRWMAWAAENRRPASYEQSSFAVGLLPAESRHTAIGEILEAALRKAGYEHVALRAAFRSSTEAFQIFRAAGLVVSDLSATNPVARELCTAAHVLGLPAIRMTGGPQGQPGELPWLLQGHPGGYQNDLVHLNNPDELPGQIEARARAMFRISRALGNEGTRSYLNSKRYSQCFVFISHTLKPPNRALVEKIYEGLGRQYVRPFEYHMANTSGDDWKAELDEQLRKTTHFVVLLSDGYELSPVCTYEIEEILKRNDVKILPFMAQGRSVPHPKLGVLHHRLLSAPDMAANADTVVQQVMKALTGAAPDS